MRSSIQQYIPILNDIHASITQHDDFPCILYDDVVYLFQYSIWSEHSKKFPWKHEAFIVTKVKQLPHTHTFQTLAVVIWINPTFLHYQSWLLQ